MSRRRWLRRNWDLRTDNAEEGGSDERRRKGRKEGRKRDVGQGDEGEIKDEKTRNMHFKNASIPPSTWTWRLTGTLSGFSYILLFAGYKA